MTGLSDVLLAALERIEAEVVAPDTRCPHDEPAPWLCGRCADDDAADLRERLGDR